MKMGHANQAYISETARAKIIQYTLTHFRQHQGYSTCIGSGIDITHLLRDRQCQVMHSDTPFTCNNVPLHLEPY